MHTHNVVFKESFFFAAHPDDIGFGDSKFYLNKEFETISLKDLGMLVLTKSLFLFTYFFSHSFCSQLGFASTDELTDYIFENFEKSKNEGKNVDLICYGRTDSERITFPSGISITIFLSKSIYNEFLCILILRINLKL